MKNMPLPSIRMLGLLVLPFVLMQMGLSQLRSATVTLNTSDAFGVSSFNSAGNWSDASAPSSGNDYYVWSGYLLRTPASSGNYTFAGNSLTLASSGSSMAYKGTGTGTDIITVNSLTMANNTVIANLTTAAFTLAGNISVASGNNANFRLDPGNASYAVASNISGSGGIYITTASASSQLSLQVALTHAGNTYSGGTTIQNFANLAVQADGALGTGNLTMNGGMLTLGGGTNNYIADSATVRFAAGLAAGAVNLNFTGSEAVAGLSLDGGSTFLSAGTYSASSLNSLYGSSVFSGTGSFNVVPEPGTGALLLLGSLVLLIAFRSARPVLKGRGNTGN